MDIGAGQGALTRYLVEAGAWVLAVELHPSRAQRLRERFAEAPVTVIQTDALSLRLPHRPFRVVANPPYAICSALLRMLLGSGSRLIAADLVLQRAVVRRHANQWRASADHPHRRWEARVGRSLPRHAFRPAPQVDSAVLVIRRRHRSPRYDT